jgi:hypothetical protein
MAWHQSLEHSDNFVHPKCAQDGCGRCAQPHEIYCQQHNQEIVAIRAGRGNNYDESQKAAHR